MRSLLFKDITFPVAFKTVPYSRRAESWEPTGFDRHGPDHAGRSCPVLVPPSAILYSLFERFERT